MRYMNKLFYELKPEGRKDKLKDRLNYDSVLVTNLQIKPMDQSNIFNLYYVPTMKTIDLIGKISKDDVILSQLYDKLPGIAKQRFIIDMLSEELYSSNTLEGVESTKGEIVNTTKEILNEENKNKININELRFSNVINSYNMLRNRELKMVTEVKDIRKIYNEVTSDGIKEEDLPDGKLFRKGHVKVEKSGKIIHNGVSSLEDTEEYIAILFDKLITFINLDEKTNNLIKNAIFHYYFGYIHPYYDGNGRTNRFISSLYLMEDFSELTALSLSQGCNAERNLYLRAFDSTNQLSMQGELNYFVDSFLSVLNCGQNILKDNLNLKVTLLKEALSKIDSDDKLDDDLKKIMGVLSQSYLFGFNESLSVKDFVEIIGLTGQTIRSKLNKLESMNLIEKTSKNPVLVVINKEYLEN